MNKNRFGNRWSAVNAACAGYTSELNRLAQPLGSVAGSMRGLQDLYAVTGMMKDLARTHELLRAAVGPVDELQQLGLLRPSLADWATLAAGNQAVRSYEAQYRLPEIAELTSLAEKVAKFTSPTLFKGISMPAAAVAEAMQLMTSPWLREHEAMLSSARGFAGLQGIGHLLNQMPAFGNDLTVALRTDLGDWRDTINWPEPIFADGVVRSAFYVERGYNPDLTDFPACAFRESVDIAGLGRKPASLLTIYGEPVPASSDPIKEDGLRRTNEAHDWLQRFELRLRQFIDETMIAGFGPDWPRRQTPNGLYDEWQKKKQKAQVQGEQDRPLLDYADFTDYALIICRTDNWKQVFASFFGRQENVRESLQRLYPIRICTMHARPITQDDQLLLFVEVKRLIAAIG